MSFALCSLLLKLTDIPGGVAVTNEKYYPDRLRKIAYENARVIGAAAHDILKDAADRMDMLETLYMRVRAFKEADWHFDPEGPPGLEAWGPVLMTLADLRREVLP